jgi:ubiquinone/menaquinone biosynthesis C-methylase UbiE
MRAVTSGSFKSETLLGNFASVDQADTADLVDRLDTMHTLDIFRSYKRETFDLMRLGPGSHAADLGCGTGEDARRMLDIVGPAGGITGFDMSAAMLAEAGARHGDAARLRFVSSSADRLDAPDASFDAIRADRVLTHVPDTDAALREMVRVVKPGGRVVVSEPDMPGCWVTNKHHGVSMRVLQVIAESCVQPYLARELYHGFLDAGLTDVTLLLRPLVVYEPEAAANILKFDGAMRSMIGEGQLDPAEAQDWLADFEERRRSGRFMAGVTIFIAAGTKPA